MKLRKGMCCSALLKSSNAFISYSRDFKLAVNYPHIRYIFSHSYENITKFGQVTTLYWVYINCVFLKIHQSLTAEDEISMNHLLSMPLLTRLNIHYSLWAVKVCLGSAETELDSSCNWSFQSLLWHQTKIRNGSAIPTWSLIPVYYCLPSIMHTATEAPWKKMRRETSWQKYRRDKRKHGSSWD